MTDRDRIEVLTVTTEILAKMIVSLNVVCQPNAPPTWEDIQNSAHAQAELQWEKAKSE